MNKEFVKKYYSGAYATKQGIECIIYPDNINLCFSLASGYNEEEAWYNAALYIYDQLELGRILEIIDVHTSNKKEGIISVLNLAEEIYYNKHDLQSYARILLAKETIKELVDLSLFEIKNVIIEKDIRIPGMGC